MTLEHTLGDQHKTHLLIKRDQFTGNFFYYVNEKKHVLRNPLKLTTHIDFKLSRQYEFEVGNEEKFQIKLIHSRPRCFGGLRPQTYELFVDDNLLETYTGF